MRTGRPPKPIIVRMMSKVEVDENECWRWKSAISHNGYSVIRHKGKNLFAHRVSYEIFRRKIPDGLTIDHLCRVRDCINPDHLEAVTSKVNSIRGTSPPAINAAKTHCKRGHPLSGSNMHINPNGARCCKECARLTMREIRARKRASSCATPKDLDAVDPED